MPILGSNSSGGSRPSAPVIGSATDGGTGTTASVAFTPSTYIGKGTITYTATSNPGGLTATGSSPITVTGLTTGTAYTFTVQGTTNYGITSEVSSASNSVTPASPTSFESIATATGNGTSSTISFTSIPSGYKSLQIRGIARAGTTGTTAGRFNISFNGATTDYATHSLLGNGTTVSATTNDFGGTAIFGFSAVAEGGLAANTFNAFIIDIIDYTSTSKTKTIKMFDGGDYNGSGAVRLVSGLWSGTSAITSITLLATGGNYTSGTSIGLYGVK